MIKYENGRYRSFRPVDETAQVLTRELKKLTAKQRAAVDEIVKHAVINKKAKSVADDAEKLEWDKSTGPPISVRQWVNDKYYLGETAETLYPCLKQDMIELFEGNYYECILTGSIGWGKDYFATTAMIRVLYELICLKSPTSTLGLGKGEVIHIVPVSHLKEAAQRVVFQGISRKLHLSPFFKGRFEETKDEIRFPGKGVIIVGGGSNDNSALGLNTWAALVDECVVGETEILTPFGYRSIDSLMTSDPVFTPIVGYDAHDGGLKVADGVIRPATVTEVFEVELEDGRAVCGTDEHPFLVERNGERGFVYLRELRIGDAVVVTEDAVRPEWRSQSVFRSNAHGGDATEDRRNAAKAHRLASLRGDEGENRDRKPETKATEGHASAETEVAGLDTGAPRAARGSDEGEMVGPRVSGDRAGGPSSERICTHAGVEGEDRGSKSEAEGSVQALRRESSKDQRGERLEGSEGRLPLQRLRGDETSREDRLPISLGKAGSDDAGRNAGRRQLSVRGACDPVRMGRTTPTNDPGLPGADDGWVYTDCGSQTARLQGQSEGERKRLGMPELLLEPQLVVCDLGRADAVARVVAIRSAGRRQTYDVMDTSYGTFIANGVVVHNTNFMGKGKRGSVSAGGQNSKHDKAQGVYDTLQRRVKSRYAAKGLKGMIFLVSSKRSIHDFTERHLIEAMNANDPGVFVRDYATWDVRQNAFQGQKWYTAAVSQKEGRTRIIGETPKVELKKELKEEEIHFSFPEEYLREFQNDPEGATRDIAGVAMESFRPFFSNRHAIEAMSKVNKPHPFYLYSWNPMREIQILWKNLVMENIHGNPVARCCPGAARHAHLDMSKNRDATGLCVGHIAGGQKVPRHDPETGELKEDVAPVIHIDFVLKIVPPHAGEIDHATVRGLVIKLRDGGLPIKSISMDTWMGLPNLQEFAKVGFKTEQVSTQKTLDPYLAAQGALYERRVFSPKYPDLEKELRELELNEDGTKVDHPKTGSKDLADAWAAVIYNLSKNAVVGGTLSLSRGESDSIKGSAGVAQPTGDGNFRWPDEPDPQIESEAGGFGTFIIT